MEREERALLAREHVDRMAELYCGEIDTAVERAIILGHIDHDMKRRIENPKYDRLTVSITTDDTCDAVFKYACDNDTIVLNYASYSHPGGKFIDGSMAQEEAICHKSTLYNVLRKKMSYYRWNELHKNRGLYLDRCLATDGIIFESDEGVVRDVTVLTIAAPFKRTFVRYGGDADTADWTMRQRVTYLCDIVKIFKPKVLIAGAWGCGVFGNDPYVVAQAFKENLMECVGYVRRVFLAIPDNAKVSRQNLRAFYDVFGSEIVSYQLKEAE